MSDLDDLTALATTAGAERVYKEGHVPASPALPYMVLGLDTGTPISTRTDGRSPNMRRRLTARLISKTDDGLRAMAAAADAAFNAVILTGFDGDPFCYRELAGPLSPARDSDAGGVLYALHTYRF